MSRIASVACFFLVLVIAAHTSVPDAAELKLSWNPNTETDLAGYKVYYGTASRIYGNPLSVGPGSTYTLQGLTPGQTYFVSITAYDTANNESGYSNEVSGVATEGVRVPLEAGWNLVSFPNLLQSIPVSDVLSSISGQYEKAYTYKACEATGSWKIYDPSLPPYANNFQAVDRATGIWIYAIRPTELMVSGVFASTTNIPLCVGSNLVSYAGSQPKPITQALASISGKYEKVYVYKASDLSDPWKIYDPALPPYVNDLTTIEPGFGYWIKVKENCTFNITN